MEIEYLNENNKKEWNQFALESDSAWFKHTTHWQEYVSSCRFDSNTKNFSFMIKQNNKIQAIVPLHSEYSYPEKNFDCFAMYGKPSVLPAYANNTEVDKEKINAAINEEIKKIIKENNIQYGEFVVEPLMKYPYFKDFSCFNMLNNHAKMNFITTNIIDLRLDEETILRKMRKGHKAAIKQVLKEKGYRVDIFNKDNITKDVFLRYKEIHKIDAGRQTRTDKSWEFMYEWILKGNAVLLMLYLDEIKDYSTGALIINYKNASFYGSYGTVNSNILNGHCGYIIQWEAIKYLKSIGIELYDIGINFYKEIKDENDKKLYEIAKFKKGFRTVEYPRIHYHIDYSDLLKGE